MVYSVIAELVSWLEDRFYEVWTIVPDDADDDLPARFVTVERTGGYVEDMLDHASVAVQCWAQTDSEAHDMAIGLRNLLLTDQRPYGVGRISIDSGPYRFYDEATRCPRYQLTLDVTCCLSD